MADINLKLTIDGKEAIQTLNLTEAQVKQLKADLDKIKNEKIKTTLETEMKGMPIDQARAMYKNLKTEFQDKIKANVPLGELDELKTKLGTVQSALNGVENESKDVAESFSKWGMMTAGLDAFKNLASDAVEIFGKPIQAAGKFESYLITMKVMLGSTEAAQARMEELVQFAASTPFEMPQVIEMGNKLQSLGMYSKEMMTTLGDLAAASGKPIEQVLGAFAKLTTGQIGDAKMQFQDLLVSAKDWDKALAGMPETAENMIKVLPQVLKDKAFTGMMDEQSKSLEGILSNLADAQAGMERSVGMVFLPAVKEAITATGSFGAAMLLVGQYATSIIPFLGSAGMAVSTLVPLFAKLKFAMVWDVQKFKTSMDTARLHMHLAGMSAQSTGVAFAGAGTTAQVSAGGFRMAGIAAKNFFLALGPIGAVTLGVTLLVGAIGLLGSSSEDTAKKMSETEKTARLEKNTYDQLTKSIQDVKLPMEERKKALTEIQQKYPGYLDNINLEKIGQQELATAIDTANKLYERRIEIMVLEEKYKEKIGNVVDKKKALDDTGYSDEYQQREIDTAIETEEYVDEKGNVVTSEGLSVLTAQQKKLKKELDETQKEADDVLDKIKKLNETDVSPTVTPTVTPKGGGGSKKTFADDLKKLEESYNTSLFKMQELDKASKEDLLKAEKKFIEDKILLYREYDKDKAPLIVELKTVITQLDIIEEEKFIKERKDSRNKGKDLGMMEQLQKDVDPNWKAPLSEQEKKRNQELINQEAELKERKEKFRISQMDNEFDRQRAMVDFEAQAELDKYKNYSNYAQMKLQIDSETADAKKKINEAENGAQISMAKETLGILATMVNEQTALGKGIAIAQAIINTHVGATTALKQGGIMGPVMMAVVIAAGMAQVAKIMETQPPQMKGYERGGIVVGEKGPEIISPMQDYASGQARLINAVLNQVGSGGDGARMESLFMGFYARLESWQTNMQFQIKRGDLYSSVQKETFNRNRRAL